MLYVKPKKKKQNTRSQNQQKTATETQHEHHGMWNIHINSRRNKKKANVIKNKSDQHIYLWRNKYYDLANVRH